MAITGLILYFYKDLGITKDVAHTFKEIHELTYYYIAFFIPLHIAGVFIADIREENGLVSDMINGGKS
jgi:Ni/Fe-hydrogenase 1 B-type cytochrome subunit